ncbi:uncharacterized protein DS421_17g576710 [Arachis hypogaea]|nr:uncharacterized protein DS421_17g576710 [Arachis hypogaea]
MLIKLPPTSNRREELKTYLGKDIQLSLPSFQVAAQALPAPEVISDILNGNWDHERTEFSIPPLMTLLLGEPGTGGSSTPSMVGAVKKWQKFDPQKSMDTWRRLSHG